MLVFNIKKHSFCLNLKKDYDMKLKKKSMITDFKEKFQIQTFSAHSQKRTPILFCSSVYDTHEYVSLKIRLIQHILLLTPFGVLTPR